MMGFDIFDAGHDSFIAAAEFIATPASSFSFVVVDSKHDGKIMRHEYEAAFDILDAKEDSCISKAEFNCASGAPLDLPDTDNPRNILENLVK